MGYWNNGLLGLLEIALSLGENPISVSLVLKLEKDISFKIKKCGIQEAESSILPSNG